MVRKASVHKDSGKKERYEVLFEDLSSQIKQLAECVMSVRDELKAEIREFRQEMYAFKSDTEAQFKLLHIAVNKNREEIMINRKAIEVNRKAIEVNRVRIDGVDSKLVRIGNRLDKQDQIIVRHDKLLVNA